MERDKIKRENPIPCNWLIRYADGSVESGGARPKEEVEHYAAERAPEKGGSFTLV